MLKLFQSHVSHNKSCYLEWSDPELLPWVQRVARQYRGNGHD